MDVFCSETTLASSTIFLNSIVIMLPQSVEMRILFLATAFMKAALAAPQPQCLLINAAVNIAHQQPAATSFCSSYLSIPVVTSTATSTTYTTYEAFSCLP